MQKWLYSGERAIFYTTYSAGSRIGALIPATIKELVVYN